MGNHRNMGAVIAATTPRYQLHDDIAIAIVVEVFERVLDRRLRLGVDPILWRVGGLPFWKHRLTNDSAVD